MKNIPLETSLFDFNGIINKMFIILFCVLWVTNADLWENYEKVIKKINQVKEDKKISMTNSEKLVDVQEYRRYLLNMDSSELNSYFLKKGWNDLVMNHEDIITKAIYYHVKENNIKTYLDRVKILQSSDDNEIKTNQFAGKTNKLEYDHIMSSISSFLGDPVAKAQDSSQFINPNKIQDLPQQEILSYILIAISSACLMVIMMTLYVTCILLRGKTIYE
jgi:tRNA nucleotidyltransferase (CCA-adding enzyme)